MVGAIVLGTFVLLIAVAIGGVYYYIQSGAGLREVTARASAWAGREITIGAADIDWGRVTHIDLTDIEVVNVEWAKAEHFLEAGKLAVDIELWPLLWGDVVVPSLALDQPKLFLERNAAGETNWSFSAQPVVSQVGTTLAPEERDEMPALDRVDIAEGELQYRDDSKELLIDGVLNLATGEASGTEAVRFSGDGKLEERPLKIDFSGGSFAMLKNSDAPYPLKLAIRFGATAIDLEGTMQDPIAMEGTDLKLTLKGPDLADVFPVLGVPAPPTPPYRLSGQLQRTGDVWAFINMSGVVGDSDLAGDVRIDYGPERPQLEADLTSQLLDFDDLAPLIGAPPDTDGEAASAEQEETAGQLAASDNLFPDMPLNFEKMTVMDMDVKLVADKVQSESYLAVSSLSGRVVIENGRAVLNPFKLGIAEGVLEGEVVLNARTEPASLSADLALQQLNVATFFKESAYFDTTNGKIDGFVKLTGTGASLADVMGSADGDMRVAMRGGAISWLLVELIGLDLGQALLLYITEDNKIPIHCGAGKIDLAQGVASFEPVVVDTTDSVLYFSGKTDLKAQTITLQVEADAKDFSLLDMDVPLLIEGKIRNPEISLGKGVPIPLIEPGDAEDLRCDQLIKTILSATN
jgi:uncharacterized protein involved in outer membrane biogenesis